MAALTPSGSGGLVSSVSLPGVTKKNPTATNVSVGAIETAVILPANTAAFQLRSRGNRPLSVATTSGGDTLTIDPGCVWTEWSINQPAGMTLYITAPATVTVELLIWEAS